MLHWLMLMLVLPLFAVPSSNACDDMTLFAAWSDESEQAAGSDRQLAQIKQKTSHSTNHAAVVRDVRTYPARARPRGRGYNSRSIDLGNGRIETQFHLKWINYLDENLTWREIDPTFIKTGAGFEITQAPFEVRAPLTAGGTATFVNNNRWDVLEQRLVDAPPLEQTLRALEVAEVPGHIEQGNLGWGETQYVIYPNAYPEVAADLIYWVHQGRVPRLRKFIRFREALKQDMAFRFEIAFTQGVALLNYGRSVKVSLSGASGTRANSMHSFYFWDSREGWSGRRTIRFDVEPLTSARADVPGTPMVYVLTKHIQADFFRSAVLPAYTDTDFFPDEFGAPGATSVDGVVDYTGPDGTEWSTVRNAAVGTSASDSATPFRITTRKCESANMSRGITDFDTSSLGSGVEIESATLYLAQCFSPPGGGCGGERPEQVTVGIVGHTPANPTTLVLSDYSNGMTLNSAVEYAPRAVMANAPNAYTSFPLNANGLAAINPTGNTNFMLRSHFDLDNVNPFCLNRELDIYASEQTGTNLDPKLSVEHAMADSDGDGIVDDIDACPEENPMSLDADLNGCLDSASGLIELIELLPSDALDDTLKNSLIQKVTSADQQASKDNLCAAINILEAFQNAVEAQRGKAFTSDTADLLVDYAANLISQFEAALAEMGQSCSQ